MLDNLPIYIVTRLYMGPCGFEEYFEFTFLGDDAFNQANMFFETLVNKSTNPKFGENEPDYSDRLFKGTVKNSLVEKDGEPLRRACYGKEEVVERKS